MPKAHLTQAFVVNAGCEVGKKKTDWYDTHIPGFILLGGGVPVKAGIAHATVRETMPPGSLRVPADQPLGLLAAALLEPESQDSLLAWGFFPEAMARPPMPEAFVLAPLAEAMLAADPVLRALFEAKLAAEPAFAADPAARLAWFAERLPSRDARTYPIRREP